MVLINFAGKEKEIRFDFNAICAIEEISGKPLQEVMTRGNAGFNTIRMLLWAGLRHDNKLITMEKAGELIQGYITTGRRIDDVMIKVMVALEESGITSSFEENEVAETEGE